MHLKAKHFRTSFLMRFTKCCAASRSAPHRTSCSNGLIIDMGRHTGRHSRRSTTSRSFRVRFCPSSLGCMRTPMLIRAVAQALELHPSRECVLIADAAVPAPGNPLSSMIFSMTCTLSLFFTSTTSTASVRSRLASWNSPWCCIIRACCFCVDREYASPILGTGNVVLSFVFCSSDPGGCYLVLLLGVSQLKLS